MDIMTTLFDQDYVTKLYGLDQKKEGIKEGIKKGIKKEKMQIAKSSKGAGMEEEFIAKYTGYQLISSEIYN